jgi:hypothetical protein
MASNMSRATLTQNESVIERVELEPGARSLATLEAWGG